MSYIDGFVIPLPSQNKELYRKIASKCGKIWMEHGALAYIEALGDDMKPKKIKATFPKISGTKKGETVVFSLIVFKSRAHRDKVNAKVMKDPRLHALMNKGGCPFDCDRMAYGGFKTIVEL